MKSSEFYFKSTKDNLDIHVYKWEPENKNPIGIVQISHGMSETAIRYEYFAKNLTDNGYIVYINDHRGHGLTAKTIDNVGCLADSDGFTYLVEDINTLTNIIKEENEDLPIFLFGHSMGSFASQRYIMEYGNNIDGLILSGSNGKHGFILNIAEKIINYEIKKKGRLHRSKALDSLIFGGNNKKFKSPRTEFDWLSRDEKEVDKYIEDPFCGVLFTCGFFYDFIKGLQEIEDKENLKKVPLDLPIYIMSGDKDPIGKNGKGVLRLRDRYIKLGVKDVLCKLYEGGRHEMLNETNKDEVIRDILNWINEKNKVNKVQEI
ncbi:MAG: alpha/beta hydrolase [Peptostreptococcaceae bacterium]|nr:alpha/beta hydrolase [Peptostreptococcaceae bacterium]MDU4936603.1 alpha/beta hydrolase [Peptostreptococcaceae bacterium]